ncbi:hypothetical protein [Larkinella terrae]|uniref:DUF4595 domain-containing protein n=1 Tax=Larkinella terrae TaxID=2025311 RepID=A0A7K0ETG8_9BACT|nr:hypothetical protein [Larkinella terrae]MRS65115.1 hypothetical protein [Larkinella terrae]
MHTFLRSVAIVTLIAVADSCAVRDHLAPETSSCRTTEFLGDLDYYVIPDGETVQIGQSVLGLSGNMIPVISIVKAGGTSLAVGYPEYTITYEYDSEGRVKKTATGGRLYRNERFTSEFSYAPNQVTEIYSAYNFRPEPYVETRVHMLNADGIEEKPNFSYANGLITEERYANYTIKNTIENGNIVKSENIPVDPSSGQQGLKTYEYDLSQLNPLPVFYPILAAPAPFKPNRNLLLKITDDDQVLDNIGPYVIEYSYVTNDWGFFQIEKVNRPNDNRISYNINGYKLSCQ